MEAITQGSLIAALLAVAVGGFIHGFLGIGFPLVTTPLIALTTDVKTAILLTLVPTLIVNIISIVQGGRWRESLGRYWPIALYTLGGSILGTQLMIVSDPAPFKLVLAGVIVFYLSTSSLRRVGWGWIHRHHRVAGLVFGTLAGLLVGVANVAVPALIIYFTELQLAPLALVQILNLCFLGGKLAQLGTFGLSGYLTPAVLLASLPLGLMAGTGLFLGMGVRRRLSADTYRRLLRRVLMIIAVVLVLQFFWER